jgi:phosphate transport system protein
MSNGSMGELTGTPIAPAPNRNFRRVQEGLWAEALGLGTVVRSAFSMSVAVLRQHRTELIAEIKASEVEIDRREVEIERECLRILALYGPVASDFRRVLTVMQVNRALERIGDLAVRIARRATKLAAVPAPIAISGPLEALAEGALTAVCDAIEALEMSDAEALRALIAADHRLKDYRGDLQSRLKDLIRRDPDRIAVWLRLIDIARDLERAGDHANRIAQALVFLKEGQIIRHERLRSTAV